MIKVSISDNEIIMLGHADYAELGYDIVCSSFSSILITTVNACLRIEKDSVEVNEENDKKTLKVLSNNETIRILIDNMLAMFQELASDYPKNIKIRRK